MTCTRFLPAALVSITAATATLLAPAATAYPVDCAILLCLSGGWPASAECSHARAVFIERITPWPIEPPLQISHCPMWVTYDLRSAQPSSERLYDIGFGGSTLSQLSQPRDPWATIPTSAPFIPDVAVAVALFAQPQVFNEPDFSGTFLQLVQQGQFLDGIADIDISGPEFEFIRSIRVFNILIDDDRTDGECDRYERVGVGTYDRQGSFIWSQATRQQIPAAFGPTRNGCHTRERAVFVEWRDFERNYGFERVDY